jgi:cytoskeletal protein CcmA (bactofilin family)
LSTFFKLHRNDIVPTNLSRGRLKIKTNVIFVQDSNGEGNFSVKNQAHMDTWKIIFEQINQRLNSLVSQSCDCSTAPLHYPNAYFEFVPKYVEVKDDFASDHYNDPSPDTWNSYDKTYLNYIHNLAKNTAGYEDGFNVIITNDGSMVNRFLNNNPNNLDVFGLGYVPLYRIGNSALAYSSYPSFDLEHPAMWHDPDRYLDYINGFKHYGGQWWIDNNWIPKTVGGFLHEYFHYFNLGHPSNQSATNCTNNIMIQAGGAPRNSLEGCQLREMYLSLMAKNIRKYVVCEDKLDFSLIVSSNETWKNNLRIFGDIVVKNGATLTVSCELHMSPKGRIIVERGGNLVIDGGLITGDCSDPWQGLIVEGDVPGKQANSGKVEFKNQAIIEKAITGISMYPFHLPWNNGGLFDYFGGVVEAENSTIRKCIRGVEFMKYGSGVDKDKSFFDNVKFENLERGVTAWSDDGVLFDNCTFSNIALKGIYAYDCGLRVRGGNKFQTQPIGVDIITTYPIAYSSKIGEIGTGLKANNFLCSNVGVNVQSGGNLDQLIIANNFFDGSAKGVRQNGNGRIDVVQNTLKNHLTAIELFDSGTDNNQIRFNSIENSFLGSQAVKNNQNTTYFVNCFSQNQLTDIAISSGSIGFRQGDATTAAGNCFTKNGIVEIDNDAGGPLEYYVKTNTTDCRKVDLVHNYSVMNANNDPTGVCGAKTTTTGEGETSRTNCVFNENQSIQNLMQERALLLQERTLLANSSDNYVKWQNDYCIESIETVIAKKMLEEGSFSPNTSIENVINFYSGEGMDFKDKTTAYGLIVHLGDLNRARTFLNSIATQTAEQNNFKAVQNINLDYLSNPFQYVLSAENKSFLYNVGTSENGPFDGYARSLYEILTGERIEVNIPNVAARPRSESKVSDNKKNNSEGFAIYPNPSLDGIFNLSISKMPENAIFQASLQDLTGRTLQNLEIRQSGIYQIGTSQLVQGVYLLKVEDSFNTIVYQSKLVITH